MSRIDEALQRYYSGEEALREAEPRPAGRPAEPMPTVALHDRDVDASASPDEWVDLRQLLWLLYRKKHQVLLIACLVLVPVGIWNVLAERLYRSSAMIQIDPEPVQVLPYREIDLPSLTPNYEVFMKSQEQILRSSKLFERVAARLAADPDPAVKAEAPLLGVHNSIQRLENTQIFRLGYVAPRPDVAAKIANWFAEEYIKLHFATRQETREKARELLKRELDTLETKVQASEKELVNYAAANNLTVTRNGGEDDLAQQKLAMLSRQVTDAESEVAVAHARADSLKTASASELPEKLVTPTISSLQTRALQLEHELTALRGTFGQNWPDVVQKRNEVALVKEQLTREQNSALASARDQAALELTAAENKRKSLAGAMSEQERLVHDVQTVSIQYNILRREVDTNQKLYEGLLERLKQTSVTAGMELGGFHVVESAVPSSRPDTPHTLWNFALGSVLGVALGVCFVFARHYWDTSVSTVEEVEHVTVLPVLGTVPELRQIKNGAAAQRKSIAQARRKSNSLSLAEPNGATVLSATNPIVSESVRNICASILLSRSTQPPRILMVTSALPGEGKTTLAAELAVAFAESGAKTLLVECDLRRPTFQHLFDINGENGLSMFLSGNTGPLPKVQSTRENLFVVAAGPTPPNPTVLLGSGKMSAFLREMLSTYRFVILDTPPVVPIADARVLARLVEGVILVVRSGSVPKPLLRRVCSLLQRDGANILGAILNGADRNGFEASNYYGYYGY